MEHVTSASPARAMKKMGQNQLSDCHNRGSLMGPERRERERQEEGGMKMSEQIIGWPWLQIGTRSAHSGWTSAGVLGSSQPAR